MAKKDAKATTDANIAKDKEKNPVASKEMEETEMAKARARYFRYAVCTILGASLLVISAGIYVYQHYGPNAANAEDKVKIDQSLSFHMEIPNYATTFNKIYYEAAYLSMLGLWTADKWTDKTINVNSTATYAPADESAGTRETTTIAFSVEVAKSRSEEILEKARGVTGEKMVENIAYVKGILDKAFAPSQVKTTFGYPNGTNKTIISYGDGREALEIWCYPGEPCNIPEDEDEEEEEEEVDSTPRLTQLSPEEADRFKEKAHVSAEL